MPKPPETRLPGAGERTKSCSLSLAQTSAQAQAEAPHSQNQFGFLPSKGIPGSALQPVRDTIYRYIAVNGTTDQTATKRWRARMRGLQFQVFKSAGWSYEKFDFEPCNDGNVTVLASNGEYYRLPERDLKPEELTSSAAEVWQREVAE